MPNYRFVLAIVIFIFACDWSEAQSLKIEISSSWGGLGTPSQSSLLIVGENGRYKAAGATVSRKSVEALLSALEEPVVMKPSIANCGIDSTWLDSNYEGALQDYTHRKLGKLSAKQIDLFKIHFTDLQNAQNSFAQLYEHWHTDDVPRLSVTITRGTSQQSIQSDSQYPFMLPWVGAGEGRGGYNCRISRAVAAIVPKGFSNRGRLSLSKSFRWRLAEQTMRSIEDQWNTLNTENLVGNQVAPVFVHYSPLKSAVGCISSVDVDYCGWNATLIDPTLPMNFVVGLSLPYRDKKHLTGIDTFLKALPKYSELVMSVPWLATYAQRHPDTTFQLRYVLDRSLSVKAQSSLEKDLREHGKGDMAAYVSRSARESAFLEVDCGRGCWSRVVVLPNRDLLLWHFKGDAVLGFPAKDLQSWEYYNWRSAGAIVKPDGTLEE